MAPPVNADRASGGIDFRRDIEPVLRARCVACHGADKKRGGLRLDRRELAEQGGESGLAILGGALVDNELFRRISSTNDLERMPPEGPPLTEDELAVFRSWIAAGSPWPAPSDEATWSWRTTALKSVEGMIDFDRRVWWLRPVLCVTLVLNLGVLVIERLKCAARIRREAAARVPPSRLMLVAEHARPAHYVALWLAMALAIAVAAIEWTAIRLGDLDRDFDAYKQMAIPTADGGSPVESDDGGMSLPPRPHHPPRMAGVYYRGNDERDARLFNGGNYLTAIFHIDLVDAEHHSIAIGDHAAAGPIFVRLEIERAPFTSRRLFAENVMASITLSAQAQHAAAGAPLEVVEKDRRWRGYFPIGDVEQRGTIEQAGQVYVYYGNSPHYVIRYDLRWTAGALAEGSEMWMANLYDLGNLAPPTPNLIPRDEWFDYRPLPVVPTPNPSDPDLLGETFWLGPNVADDDAPIVAPP